MKSIALVLTTALTLGAVAQDGPILKDPKNLSLRNEVQLAIDRGLAFLKTQQKEDGSFANPEHPALSALAVIAFQRSPGGENIKNPPAFLQKSYDFLRSNVK